MKINRLFSSDDDFTIQDGVLIQYNGTASVVEVPHGVTEIGKEAFKENLCLTKITLPDTVQSIGKSAFEGCIHLTWVSLSKGLLIIEDSAFSFCTSLKCINLPAGVTEIGNNAFSDCYSLESLTLPDGLKSVGKYAFAYCYNVKSLVIPDGVEDIENTAFTGCKDLVYLTLSEETDPSSFYLFDTFYLHDCRKISFLVLTGEKADIINKAHNYYLGHIIHSTDEINTFITRLTNINTLDYYYDKGNIESRIFFLYPVKRSYNKLFDELISQPLILTELTGNKVLSRSEADFLLHNEKTSIECRTILMEYLLGIQ